MGWKVWKDLERLDDESNVSWREVEAVTGDAVTRGRIQYGRGGLRRRVSVRSGDVLTNTAGKA
jgi:hypothetical protein